MLSIGRPLKDMLESPEPNSSSIFGRGMSEDLGPDLGAAGELRPPPGWSGRARAQFVISGANAVATPTAITPAGRRCDGRGHAQEEAGPGHDQSHQRRDKRGPGVGADQDGGAQCQRDEHVRPVIARRHPQHRRRPEQHGRVVGDLGGRDGPERPREPSLEGRTRDPAEIRPGHDGAEDDPGGTAVGAQQRKVGRPHQGVRHREDQRETNQPACAEVEPRTNSLWMLTIRATTPSMVSSTRITLDRTTTLGFTASASITASTARPGSATDRSAEGSAPRSGSRRRPGR